MQVLTKRQTQVLRLLQTVSPQPTSREIGEALGIGGVHQILKVLVRKGRIQLSGRSRAIRVLVPLEGPVPVEHASAATKVDKVAVICQQFSTGAFRADVALDAIRNVVAVTQ